MHQEYPRLQYSAALIGDGSEVLGYDDQISADHHWGPRLTLFLTGSNYELFQGRISDYLAYHLPFDFMGYATNFGDPDPEDNNTRMLAVTDKYPIKHRVEISTARKFVLEYLDFDISKLIHPADWLTFPQCKLRGLTGGEIFRDQIKLHKTLKGFEFYPHDLWLYLLACGWKRIAQEEHLVGRATQVGDKLGSALIAGRLVRDIMRLCFLMQKKYAPYAKWLGTAFKELKGVERLSQYLEKVVSAADYQDREKYLCQAYTILVQKHNDLEITENASDKVSNFFQRPFKIINAERIVSSILKRITGDDIMKICRKPLIGNIDMISDNTDFLTNQSWRTYLRAMFE